MKLKGQYFNTIAEIRWFRPKSFLLFQKKIMRDISRNYTIVIKTITPDIKNIISDKQCFE